MARLVRGVLGQFVHVDGAADAIRQLKSAGFADLTVYTAAPNHEIDDALGAPVSNVRLFTLIGGLTGCAAGFGVSLWMSNDWPLATGGKPIPAIPPFLVIGFELTILCGALASVAGIIILSMMKSLKGRPYDPRFSDDRIGVFVPCLPDRAPSVEQVMKQNGSVEVSNDA